MLRSNLSYGLANIVNFAALGGLLISLTACGSADTGMTLSSIASPAASGTWAKQLILSSESAAAGIRSNSKIERLILVQANQDGNTLSTSEQICDVNTAGSRSSSLKFPEALKRALPSSKVNYEMVTSGDQWQLQTSQLTEVLGSQLSAPESEALPTKANDPRVFDQDGDGQPGVTVEVTARALLVTLNGRIYLTQRTNMQLSGRLVAPDHIEGKVNWSIDQRILGSDSTILGSVNPSITPLMDQSTFRMRKLADGAGCAELLAGRDQLFGPLSP